jgi:hypothetical protein
MTLFEGLKLQLLLGLGFIAILRRFFAWIFSLLEVGGLGHHYDEVRIGHI